MYSGANPNTSNLTATSASCRLRSQPIRPAWNGTCSDASRLATHSVGKRDGATQPARECRRWDWSTEPGGARRVGRGGPALGCASARGIPLGMGVAGGHRLFLGVGSGGVADGRRGGRHVGVCSAGVRARGDRSELRPGAGPDRFGDRGASGRPGYGRVCGGGQGDADRSERVAGGRFRIRVHRTTRRIGSFWRRGRRWTGSAGRMTSGAVQLSERAGGRTQCRPLAERQPRSGRATSRPTGACSSITRWATCSASTIPHVQCPRPGQPAPVMAQQSSELNGCLPNPWPLRWELDCAARHEEPLAPGLRGPPAEQLRAVVGGTPMSSGSRDRRNR